jgi:DNA-binding response OmpR family regulator
MQSILVVEDEPTLAKIIQAKLEEEGFAVTRAHDGEEAVIALSGPTLPDLVLLDLLLPKIPGLEVLERLGKEGKTIPKVIIFSNFADQADVDRAKQLGVVDYIVKAAFSPAEIISKIKGVLGSGSESGSSEGNHYADFESVNEEAPVSGVQQSGESNNNP